MRHAQRGFTLLEMMVVVGIIALLAVVSVPLFNAIMGQAQASSAATRIESAIQQARSMALTNRAVFSVEFAVVPYLVSDNKVLVVYIDQEESYYDDGPQMFEDYADFESADARYKGGPYMIEGVDVDAFENNSTIANGWAGADDETDGGSKWPDIAIGPEGYILDPHGERTIRIKVEEETVDLEILRFGSTRIHRDTGS